MELYDRFRNNLSDKWVINPDTGILLAVSGGSDSIAMLHLFHRLSQEQTLRIGITYVNHNLRPESADEAEFIKELCRHLEFSYWELVLDPSEKTAGASTEAWARTERYIVLSEFCEREKYAYIATAHHLNDQAETVLMRVSEGSGLDGLQGIREQRGNIIRPLLIFERHELDKYNTDHGFKWLEDTTNLDTSIPRNYIRHKIVKQWHQDNPKLLEAIQFLSERTSEHTRALNFIVDRILPELSVKQEDSIYQLNGEHLSQLPVLVQQLIIRRLMGASEQPWRRFRWNSLERFLANPATGRFHELPMGWILLSERGNWLLAQAPKKSECHAVVKPNSVTSCGYFMLRYRSVVTGKQFTDTPWIEYIDGDFLQGKSLIVRNWLPGDRFQPLGMSGRKKVSDFLIDNRVDRFQKNRQLVLVADEDIIWVCGRRISELVKIKPDTQSIVELSIEPQVG